MQRRPCRRARCYGSPEPDRWAHDHRQGDGCERYRCSARERYPCGRPRPARERKPRDGPRPARHRGDDGRWDGYPRHRFYARRRKLHGRWRVRATVRHVDGATIPIATRWRRFAGWLGAAGQIGAGCFSRRFVRVWSTVLRAWSTDLRAWSTDLRAWSTDLRAWSTDLGGSLVDGSWGSLVTGSWRSLVTGSWRSLVTGSWRSLVTGSWRSLVTGSWRSLTSPDVSLDCWSPESPGSANASAPLAPPIISPDTARQAEAAFNTRDRSNFITPHGIARQPFDGAKIVAQTRFTVCYWMRIGSAGPHPAERKAPTIAFGQHNCSHDREMSTR